MTLPFSTDLLQRVLLLLVASAFHPSKPVAPTSVSLVFPGRQGCDPPVALMPGHAHSASTLATTHLQHALPAHFSSWLRGRGAVHTSTPWAVSSIFTQDLHCPSLCTWGATRLPVFRHLRLGRYVALAEEGTDPHRHWQKHFFLSSGHGSMSAGVPEAMGSMLGMSHGVKSAPREKPLWF